MKRLREFDVLKGLSITAVILIHVKAMAWVPLTLPQLLILFTLS